MQKKVIYVGPSDTGLFVQQFLSKNHSARTVRLSYTQFYDKKYDPRFDMLVLYSQKDQHSLLEKSCARLTTKKPIIFLTEKSNSLDLKKHFKSL